MPAARPGTPAHPRNDIVAIVTGLRRIVRALELYSQDVRRSFGLTGPQLWALKTLERTGPLTAGDLATELLVQQSSLSLLIRRLERRGLVRRARLKDDRRFVRIELTEKAIPICRSAPAPTQGRLRHGLERMSRARLARIRQSVEDLTGAMEAEDVEARFFFGGDRE
jgi:DNA-binding MarR family transcriptional regulator